MQSVPRGWTKVLLAPVYRDYADNEPMIGWWSGVAWWLDGDIHNPWADSDFTHWMPLPKMPSVEKSD